MARGDRRQRFGVSGCGQVTRAVRESIMFRNLDPGLAASAGDQCGECLVPSTLRLSRNLLVPSSFGMPQLVNASLASVGGLWADAEPSPHGAAQQIAGIGDRSMHVHGRIDLSPKRT